MNKSLKLVLLVLVFLAVAVGGYFFPRPLFVKHLGAEGDTNFTNLVLSGYASVAGQATVAGIVNSSGTTIGSGTNISKISCATKNQTIASLGSEATSTFDITLSGVSTSSNQVYFLGYATSTPISLIFQVRPTSTAGYLNVLVTNMTSTQAAVATTTFSACYLQF